MRKTYWWKGMNDDISDGYGPARVQRPNYAETETREVLKKICVLLDDGGQGIQGSEISANA